MKTLSFYSLILLITCALAPSSHAYESVEKYCGTVVNSLDSFILVTNDGAMLRYSGAVLAIPNLAEKRMVTLAQSRAIETKLVQATVGTRICVNGILSEGSINGKILWVQSIVRD